MQTDGTRLDAKHKVLVAFYAEYQKDLPKCKSIYHSAMGMKQDVFNVAVQKLHSECLIIDAQITGDGNSPYPAWVNVEDVKMSSAGVRYVESLFRIPASPCAEDRLRPLLQAVREAKWDEGIQYIEGVLADVTGGKPL